MNVLAIAGALAEDEPRNTGPDFGKASPFGLLIIVLLLLGTILLVWSMNRQLKKVPRSFDDPAGDRIADGGTVGTAPDGSGEPQGGAAESSGSPPEPGG